MHQQLQDQVPLMTSKHEKQLAELKSNLRSLFAKSVEALSVFIHIDDSSMKLENPQDMVSFLDQINRAIGNQQTPRYQDGHRI